MAAEPESPHWPERWPQPTKERPFRPIRFGLLCFVAVFIVAPLLLFVTCVGSSKVEDHQFERRQQELAKVGDTISADIEAFRTSRGRYPERLTDLGDKYLVAQTFTSPNEKEHESLEWRYQADAVGSAFRLTARYLGRLPPGFGFSIGGYSAILAYRSNPADQPVATVNPQKFSVSEFRDRWLLLRDSGCTYRWSVTGP
jgi:hypothetical protein